MSPEWKFHITLYTPEWYEIQLWCQSHIGEFDVDWYKLGIDPAEYVITGITRTVWCFKHEAHAIKFKKAWT